MEPGEPLFFGLSIGLSICGIAASLLAAGLVERARGGVLLLSGGVLVAATVFHLAPEAVAIGTAGLLGLALGACFGAMMEFGGRHLIAAGSSNSRQVVAPIALIALSVHSTVDGALYALSFAHDHASGIAAGVGLALHEAPEGAVALMLALQSGWGRWKAILAAFAASTLTTPVGWWAGTMLGEAAHEWIEVLFAGSVGLLGYSGLRLVFGGWRQISRASSATP